MLANISSNKIILGRLCVFHLYTFLYIYIYIYTQTHTHTHTQLKEIKIAAPWICFNSLKIKYTSNIVGLVSLFNGISTFIGYLTSKPFL